MAKVCIFFADGLEEIEGLTVVDLLRRAGIDIHIVSISDSLKVMGAHHIEITADTTFENEDFSDFEDCLQMECARDYGAKYIVTRNIADYEKSEIKAISPSDFLKGELMH